MPRSILPSSSAAPRRIAVYGIRAPAKGASVCAIDGDLLGEFEYDLDGAALQTFDLKVTAALRLRLRRSVPLTRLPAQQATGPATHVRLEVRSNYGNPAYTCIYRFRVHGDQV